MTLEWTSTGSRLVYEEMTATVTFKDNDVRALYIDWDDGESNKKEEANYQWVQFTEPKKSVEVKHTYTKAAAFIPVIQTINSQGMASKYMSSAATNTDVTPYVTAAGGAMETLTILDRTPTAVMRVENKTVESGIDNSIFDSDGALDLYVSIPPLCTETDLTAWEPKIALTCLIELDMVYASGAKDEGAATFDPVHTPQVGVERIVHTFETTLLTLSSQTGVYLINDNVAATPFCKVRKVLEAKLITVRPPTAGYSQDAAFNKLKIFVLAKGSDDNYYPITYITPGTPIKKEADKHRYITMDFSQSRASASNYSPSFYNYDLGKSWFSPYKKWETTGTAGALTFDSTTSSSAVTKEVHYTYMPRPDGLMGNGTTASTVGGNNWVQAFGDSSNFYWMLTGTNDPRTDQFPLNDFNAFFDQYHLVRNTVDVTGTSKNTTVPAFEGGVFRICPAAEWVSGSQESDPLFANSNSICKLYTSGNKDVGSNRGTGSVGVTSGSYNNDTSLLSGAVYMREWNYVTFKDRLGTTRDASEYFIMASAVKHNKIFFNISPYAKDLQSDLAGFDNGTTIAGVYYLRVNNSETFNQSVEWVPLEFEDTTAVTREYRDTSSLKYVEKTESFAKSGYITFDMPDDWGAITISGMIGNASLGVDESTTPIGPTEEPNVYQIPLTGWECTATGALSSAAGVDGKFVTLTGSSTDLDLMVADDIGVMEFMAFITSGTSTLPSEMAGENFWCCSGVTNGFLYGTSGASDHTIYLHVGNKEWDNATLSGRFGSFDIGEEYGISLRRINIYDVFDGASKVWSSSPTEDVGVWDMDMVDAFASEPGGGSDYIPWPNRYCFSGFGTDGAGGSRGYGSQILLDVSGSLWNGETGMYPLKIVVSGGHMPSSSGATGITGPELWNIIPFDNSSSQVIKEIDDHAFSLNSIPITSDISITRGGAYYQAITRKGKVFIVRTGDVISSIGFTSVAMGDEKAATAFADRGPSTGYGYLRLLRKAQAEDARVYWDEPQKDGTYVRFWGVVTEVSESHPVGSPTVIVTFNVSMVIEEIALIDENGDLITDIFPLGGIVDEKDFT